MLVGPVTGWARSAAVSEAGTSGTGRIPTIVTGGGVVSASWDDDGRFQVRIDIDGIPDSRLIDDQVPLVVSVGDQQVFPPVDTDDDWYDEL